VTQQTLDLVQAHMGHACDATAVPPVPGARVAILNQNAPNPFNPKTCLRVDLVRPAAQASLRIYDLQGRRVRELHVGPLPSGPSEFWWDGRAEGGARVAGGVYIARLATLGISDAIRMVLVN
jgi:hypothetical protein